MKSKSFFVEICLLIALTVGACGSPTVDIDAQATRIAGEIFATQTAQAPAEVEPTPTKTKVSATATSTPAPTTATPTITVTPTAMVTETEPSSNEQEDTLQPTETPTPTPTATPAPVARIVADVINLRAGPNINYPVVGESHQGDILPITGRDASPVGWWQVIAADGQTAWVNAGLVEASGAEAVAQVEASLLPTAIPNAAEGTAPGAAPAGGPNGGQWVLVADSAADFPGPIQNRKWYYHWSKGRNNFIWQDMTQGPECYHAPNEMTLEICRDRMKVDTCEGKEIGGWDCSRGDTALLWKATEGGTYHFEWLADEVEEESSIWFYKHLDRAYNVEPGFELPYSATIKDVIQWELFFWVPQYDTPYRVKVYKLQ